MQNIKTVIFIGGYANAGKTTAINYLKSKNISCFSTSALLHEFVQNTYHYIMGLTLDTQNKNSFAVRFLANSGMRSKRVPMRDFLIYFAEEILVKTFGRNIFATGITNQINNSTDKLIIIETIGGEEFDALDKLIFSEYTRIYVNIRSNQELKGIDIRKLLPSGITINNNNSFEELYSQLDRLMEMVK